MAKGTDVEDTKRPHPRKHGTSGQADSPLRRGPSTGAASPIRWRTATIVALGRTRAIPNRYHRPTDEQCPATSPLAPAQLPQAVVGGDRKPVRDSGQRLGNPAH